MRREGQPGTFFLHYRVVEKIGEGVMGAAWRATDATLDRDVAIKVLPADFASDAARLGKGSVVLSAFKNPHFRESIERSRTLPILQAAKSLEQFSSGKCVASRRGIPGPRSGFRRTSASSRFATSSKRSFPP